MHTLVYIRRHKGFNNIVLNYARNNLKSTEISRSEEHTSELQSRSDLVCRLLLEKKNTQIKYTGSHMHKTNAILQHK